MISFVPYLFLINGFLFFEPVYSQNSVSLVYETMMGFTQNDVLQLMTPTNDLNFNLTSSDYFGFNSTSPFTFNIDIAFSNERLSSINRADDETLLDLSDNWISSDSYQVSYSGDYEYKDFSLNVNYTDTAIINSLLSGNTVYLYFGISFQNLDISNFPIDSSSFTLNVTNFNFNDDYESGYSNGLSVGYSNGYNNGVNDTTNTYTPIISGLNNQINNLQDVINSYRDGNISLVSCIWAIASTPFEAFKQIWDVDLLGINLGNFTIALMLVGIVVFIWKKFLGGD